MYCSRKETLVRAVITFLSGAAAVIAGLFAHSCGGSLPQDLLHSWCGVPPPQPAFLAHLHCAGCVTIGAGVGLLALSILMAVWPELRLRMAKP